jgi:EAL domain-containing protein (putative c-di-GMP-specific phosphodiesterase class I)
MRDAILERHGLRSELELALARGELLVQFQPIIDVRSGQAAAVEALVRWEHPVRGRVPPIVFIGLAEETGLIVPLGRWVLREACRHAATWRTAGVDGAPLAVHVNLSARELEDPEVVSAVADAIASTGIEPQQLVLELTESLLVQDATRGASTLAGLRALGVRLALDDFGTGFSSLSYLRTLPLDQLKIAREFVDGLGRHAADDAFVRMILELAQGIGLEVVAEGVETQAQFEQLQALGCDLAQGYLFARPTDADAVLAAFPRRAVV